MRTFLEKRLAWFQGHSFFLNGIPSVDTLARVISGVDIDQIEQFMRSCVASLFSGEMDDIGDLYNRSQDVPELKDIEDNILSLDGKTVRGAIKGGDRKIKIHIVNALVNGLCSSQITVYDKTNEIAVIPDILKVLGDMGLVKGLTVTMDAMGYQKSITGEIINCEGNYVIGLKGNQGNLQEAVKTIFTEELNNFPDEFTFGQYETVEKGHGRIESRKVTQIVLTEQHKDWLPKNTFSDSAGLGSVVRVESEVTPNVSGVAGETKFESRYDISSLLLDAKKAVPGH
jgi:predicted transposase YbfD/YdcC